VDWTYGWTEIKKDVRPTAAPCDVVRPAIEETVFFGGVAAQHRLQDRPLQHMYSFNGRVDEDSVSITPGERFGPGCVDRTAQVSSSAACAREDRREDYVQY